MKTALLSILFFAFTTRCLAAENERESQIDDIREAVFRWQFEHNASALQKNAKVYFLRIDKNKSDPSDAFMKRFAEHNPPVRKVSACSSDPDKGVQDKKTGEKGLIFNVIEIRWISDAEVEAAGGYYEAGLSASGNIYTLKKENGKWKVTSDKMRWIS